jgi:hypothetical protein
MSDGSSESLRMLTVENRVVVSRSELPVTNEPVTRSDGGCAGEERATWSPDGTRVYRNLEQRCEGGNTRVVSAIMSAADPDEWVEVQTVRVGGQTGVRVSRYAEVRDMNVLPEEVAAALRADVVASRAARLSASAPATVETIIEASSRVDAATVEAWLAERRDRIALDGQQLLAMKRAGVAPAVSDLVVALAYPNLFVVRHSTREGESGAAIESATPTTVQYGVGGGGYAMAPFYYDPFARYDPFYGFSRYGSLRSGFGTSRYYNNYAVAIFLVSSGAQIVDGRITLPDDGGRVVNGKGYTRASSGSSNSRIGGSSSSRGTSTSGSSGSGSASSSGNQGSTSSGSTTTGRTAKPRVPPPL